MSIQALKKFSPKPVPPEYLWAFNNAQRSGPTVMLEAFKLYGLRELVGDKHSPEIIGMAESLGGAIASFYTADEIPWCGLFVSYVLKTSGFEPPKDYSQVRAREFSSWGNAVTRPAFGDVLSFWRGSPSGKDGHVGFYLAEDPSSFYVLGGNQSSEDKNNRGEVNISRLGKNRLIAARRCPWRVAQPSGVKSFILKKTGGKLSENEA